MPIAGGNLIASSQCIVRSDYAPPGTIASARPLKNRAIKQLSNDSIDSLEFGVGDGKAGVFVCQDRAIPAGTAVTYDLYTGTDLVGLSDESAPFRTIRFIKVSIREGGDSSGVRIGAASSNEWQGFFAAAGDAYDIFPSGPPFHGGSPAGVTVTSSTKNLKIENLGAAEVVVRIVLAGDSLATGEWMGFWGFMTYA